MIIVGANMKQNLEMIAAKIRCLYFSDDWTDENKSLYFKNMETMLFGK